MYKINVDLEDSSKNETQELLGIMVDVLETMNNVDDVPTFNIKMKLVNNIDFIIDHLMNSYVDRK